MILLRFRQRSPYSATMLSSIGQTESGGHVVKTPTPPWRIADSPALGSAVSNAYLDSLGILHLTRSH